MENGDYLAGKAQQEAASPRVCDIQSESFLSNSQLPAPTRFRSKRKSETNSNSEQSQPTKLHTSLNLIFEAHRELIRNMIADPDFLVKDFTG